MCLKPLYSFDFDVLLHIRCAHGGGCPQLRHEATPGLTFHRVHEHPHRDGVRRPLGPGRQRARQRLPVVLQPRLVLD